jgi:putative nucleotidyltransferase with HDIG domain
VTTVQALFFAVALGIGFFIALAPVFPGELDVQEGDIAARTIRSPSSVTFESELLTEQRRDEAAAAIPEVLSFDAGIQPDQLDKLDAAIQGIAEVRDNPLLRPVDRRAELLRVENLSGLSRDSIDTILLLPPERWPALADEARRVLDDVMSQSIAQDGVEPLRAGLEQRVSPDFNAAEALVVAELARPLVAPTLIEDPARTEEAREAARLNIEPVQQSIAEGQAVVERDQTIDATSIEILREVGLLDPGIDWDLVMAAAVVAAVGAISVALYVLAFQPEALSSTRGLILLAVVVALPVLVARLYIGLTIDDEERRFLAYLLPIAAAPMLVAGLVAARLSLVIGLVMAALVTFAVVYQPSTTLVDAITPLDALRVLFVYGFGALIGIWAVWRAERLGQYLAGGLAVAAVVAVVLFVTWLIDTDREAQDLAWIAAVSAMNGIGAGLVTAGGFVAVGSVFGVTTRLQLMELGQLNAPLLRRLQDEAPGTFHHSIIVGNLAERAADQIGADALLVRVGCYYHDIGKVLQPGFYIENQLGGDNPHDGLEPNASAEIIARHVREGLTLAQEHGLPPRIQAFIPEHHGTRLIVYFYRLASQKDPHVDQMDFRYPGPRPQSPETAIVMLADSVEAVVRASSDRSAERISALVDEVIAERVAEGELDECDLTLRQLRIVGESFKQTLRGVYHPRIEYPEPSAAERLALLGRFRIGRRPRSLPPAPAPAREGQRPTW